MANNEDIARIGYVLENYEEIELLDNESKEFRDKKQKPAPMVRMSKRVDGTFYVVEAVPDTKAKKLAVVSAYIEKPSQQTRDVQASLWNVRNASADNGSMDSIAENEPIVNKNAPGAENATFGESGSKAMRAVLPNPTPEEYRAFAQVYNISAEGRMQSADSAGVLESARAVLSPEGFRDRVPRAFARWGIGRDSCTSLWCYNGR